MIGQPLFERHTSVLWGAWMKDAKADSAEAGYIWVTKHYTGDTLSVYESSEAFHRDKALAVYELDERFYGTGHVVFEGSFFYHRAGHSEIVKYDFVQRSIVARLHLHDSNFNGNRFLYTSEGNYFDLAVDENGLWLIYAASSDDHSILVSKLNPWNLAKQNTWNISVRHQEYGNGFVTCGVLYLVKDTRTKNTVVDIAYDLYNNKMHSVRLKFTNPFKMNNMISYNPRDQKIYGWDKGYQITYPVLLV